MMHWKVRRSLYDYVQGDLDATQAKAIVAHLARCNRCYAEFQILREAVRLVAPASERPSASRSDEYWAQFASAVDARTNMPKAKALATNPIIEELLSMFEYRRSLVTAGIGVALVALVSLIVWSSGLLQQTAVEELAQTGGEGEADFVSTELADYYRKSKILLVGISNIDQESGQRIDLSVERQAARQLIQQTRYLDTKELDERSRALVRALERILIELANMEQHADLKDVDIVRAGIHQENMLFKIRMAESDYSTAQYYGMSTKN